MDFEKITTEDAEQLLKMNPVAILPIGAIEAHGPHLPLGTDNYLANNIARKVESRLNHCILLPMFHYGQVWSLRDFPGSLNVSNQVLSGFICDIGRSLFRQGVKILAIINAHMGNLVAIKEASRTLYDENGMKVLSLTYPGTSEIQKNVQKSDRVHPIYFHACELETSYMLYLAPEHVQMSKAIKNYPELPIDFDVTPTPWSKITDDSVLGDATAATAEKGKAVIEATVNEILKIIVKVKDELRINS